MFPQLCTGCGVCVRQCPTCDRPAPGGGQRDRSLQQHRKGGVTRIACSSGCIGCMKCQKNCPTDAIKVVDNLARIDYDKCVGCIACVEGCPVGCLQRL